MHESQKIDQEINAAIELFVNGSHVHCADRFRDNDSFVRSQILNVFEKDCAMNNLYWFLFAVHQEYSRGRSYGW